MKCKICNVKIKKDSKIHYARMADSLLSFQICEKCEKCGEKDIDLKCKYLFFTLICIYLFFYISFFARVWFL